MTSPGLTLISAPNTGESGTSDTGESAPWALDVEPAKNSTCKQKMTSEFHNPCCLQQTCFKKYNLYHNRFQNNCFSRMLPFRIFSTLHQCHVLAINIIFIILIFYIMYYKYFMIFANLRWYNNACWWLVCQLNMGSTMKSVAKINLQFYVNWFEFIYWMLGEGTSDVNLSSSARLFCLILHEILN